jgi:hypothetical protein
LLSWVLSFVPPTSLLSLFLSTDHVIEGRQKKKMKPTPTSSTCKCYYHLLHLQVSELKKKRRHSTFSPTLCFLLSHLAHSDEDPGNQQRKRLKVSHRSTKEDDRLPTSIAMLLFISLPLASSFFESRDEIPFKGGRFVTP